MSASRKWVIAIVAAALVLRLLFCVLVVGVARAPRGDEIDYHAIASHLAGGEGYVLANGQVTSRRPPLYPLFLSLLYRFSGPNIAAARLAQTLLGTLVVWLAYLVARRYFAQRTALTAALLVAVNPFLIFISAYVMTENLYLAAVLLLLFLAPGPDAMPATPRRLVATAVVVAALVMVRPNGFLFALWMIGWTLVVGAGTWASRLKTSAVIVAAVVVALAPWAVRNHVVFDKWMLFTTHGGITFYQGNNPVVLDTPQYYGGVAPLQALPGYDRLVRMGEVQKDEAAWSLGKRFLRENKPRVPVLVLRKLRRFWRLESDVGLSGIRSGWWFSRKSAFGRLASSLDVGFVYSLFVLPLFVAGLAVTWRDHRKFLWLYGLLILQIATAVVFFGSLRMRIPIEPLMALFAAHTVWLIGPAVARRLRRP